MTRKEIAEIKKQILDGFKALDDHRPEDGNIPDLPSYTNGQILDIIEYMERLEKRMDKLRVMFIHEDPK